MNKDIIEKIAELVAEGNSPKSIAEYLGEVIEFETFDDGVNQDRYIVKSRDGNMDICIAINHFKLVDWISLKGEKMNLTYDYFENISENVKVHNNTYDNSSNRQLIFYPVLKSGLQGVFAWIKNEECNSDNFNVLKLKNLILHFGKNKIPVPSREWVYMIEK